MAGAPPGLQNRCGPVSGSGGFDSRPPPRTVLARGAASDPPSQNGPLPPCCNLASMTQIRNLFRAGTGTGNETSNKEIRFPRHHHSVQPPKPDREECGFPDNSPASGAWTSIFRLPATTYSLGCVLSRLPGTMRIKGGPPPVFRMRKTPTSRQAEGASNRVERSETARRLPKRRPLAGGGIVQHRTRPARSSPDI